MKNKFFLFALSSLFAVLLGLTSCNKCEKECQNGNCVDKECVCVDGYEGEWCTDEVRDMFIGTYTAAAGSQTSSDNGVTWFPYSANCVITANASDITKLTITNFADMNSLLAANAEDVTGVIDYSNNTITVSPQAVGSITYFGSGGFDNGILTFDHSFINSNNDTFPSISQLKL